MLVRQYDDHIFYTPLDMLRKMLKLSAVKIFVKLQLACQQTLCGSDIIKPQNLKPIINFESSFQFIYLFLPLGLQFLCHSPPIFLSLFTLLFYKYIFVSTVYQSSKKLDLDLHFLTSINKTKNTLLSHHFNMIPNLSLSVFFIHNFQPIY